MDKFLNVCLIGGEYRDDLYASYPLEVVWQRLREARAIVASVPTAVPLDSVTLDLRPREVVGYSGALEDDDGEDRYGEGPVIEDAPLKGEHVRTETERVVFHSLLKYETGKHEVVSLSLQLVQRHDDYLYDAYIRLNEIEE